MRTTLSKGGVRNFYCPPVFFHPIGVQTEDLKTFGRIGNRRSMTSTVPLTISHKCLGPHLKIVLNRLQFHMTPFLELYRTPLESFHFWFGCCPYLGLVYRCYRVRVSITQSNGFTRKLIPCSLQIELNGRGGPGVS